MQPLFDHHGALYTGHTTAAVSANFQPDVMRLRGRIGRPTSHNISQIVLSHGKHVFPQILDAVLSRVPHPLHGKRTCHGNPRLIPLDHLSDVLMFFGFAAYRYTLRISNTAVPLFQNLYIVQRILRQHIFAYRTCVQLSQIGLCFQLSLLFGI